MNLNIKKGFRDKTLLSFTSRAGFFAALFVLLSSSAFANIFRYVQTTQMNEEQTHYYNVILSDETTANTHLFTFDFESLKSDQLTLQLPDGVVIQPRKIVAPNSSFGSRIVWVGRFGENGEVHLVPHFKKEMLTGHIHTGLKTYAIRSLTGGLQVLIEYDDFGLETCGHDHHKNLDKDINNTPHIPTHEDEIKYENSPQVESLVLQDECYIRVLVGYTTTVASNEADPLGLIMTAISLANTGYSNSGIDQELQLVRVYNTGYSDAGQLQGDVLPLWKDNGDGVMDAVHSERNLYDADVCALITNIGSGIAYTNPTESLAFSLTRRTRISGFTFHHELGHNHGCFHDPPNNTGSGVGSNYQGYGHPSGFFRTVMSYECPGGVACDRVNEFSGTSNFYFYAPTSTFYLTGTATQNNVLGHNTNNGTVVDHRLVPNALNYGGSYSFEEFEFANLSGETSAKYSSNTNQMIYQDGSEGSFSAGDSIILGRGFEVKTGAVFTAYLEPTCTPISVNSTPPVTQLTDGNTTDEVHGHQHKNHDHGVGFDNIEAFPNPFKVTATIQYTVKEDGPVSISVFDINGKMVTNLVNSSNHLSGEHRVTFDGVKLPAGMYQCRMITKDGVKVIALSLSK